MLLQVSRVRKLILLGPITLPRLVGTFILRDSRPIVLMVVVCVRLRATLLMFPMFTVPVTLWHPLLAVGVPQVTMAGRTTVPVMLRGALHIVFSGRVTERITFRFIPEKFTLVTHRFSVTFLWFLGAPVMVLCRPPSTTLTVPRRNTLSTL